MLNIGYRKNLHFRHFFKVKNFVQNLFFFVQNFDNSIKIIVNFYNQVEFWKKV